MFSFLLRELDLHLSDLIIKTRKKIVTFLIVILYEHDALLLSKPRLVYLANVMMPRANEDIPTSVRAQEFVPGIVWTPVNRVLHSNSIHEKKEKKRERSVRVARPQAE